MNRSCRLSFFNTYTVQPGQLINNGGVPVDLACDMSGKMATVLVARFAGRGYSIVAGNRYEWKAGDLMLSAPGWAVHNHASYDASPVYELTIQDQPLNIYMESLLWQEDLKHPAVVLGAETGFATNRKTAA